MAKKTPEKLPIVCEVFNASRGCCDGMPRPASAALHRLGRNLREAREKKGDLVELMAARCYTTPMVINWIEAGDPHVPMGVLASYLYMLDRDAELALVCHPGGQGLELLRENIDETVAKFRAHLEEFKELCGSQAKL